MKGHYLALKVAKSSISLVDTAPQLSRLSQHWLATLIQHARTETGRASGDVANAQTRLGLEFNTQRFRLGARGRLDRQWSHIRGFFGFGKIKTEILSCVHREFFFIVQCVCLSLA